MTPCNSRSPFARLSIVAVGEVAAFQDFRYDDGTSAPALIAICRAGQVIAL